MLKGEKETTIYDIAKVLSLSPSTISRGLNNDPKVKKSTADKIKETAKLFNYHCNSSARNLRHNKTKTIGVIIPRLNSIFMASALAGIEHVTSSNGYGLIISQSQESWKKEISCVSTMFSSRVDGLIVSLAYNTHNTKHFDIMFDRNTPIVFFDRVAKYKNCKRVIIDNYKAGYEVTSHLIDMGCRRIMHLSGNMYRNVYRKRLEGYKKALEDNGITFDKTLVDTGELTPEYGIKTADKILRMPVLPDAIFTANDNTAITVMAELMKHGIKVPDDIAVAGFNNEPVSRIICPNLTTVEYPAMKMGETAATILIDKLKNKDKKDKTKKEIILKHTLIIRESTKKRK